MAFMRDKQEIKPGLIIFRRADVQHDEWYCRIRVPKVDRYKTLSLKTTNVDKAKTEAGEKEFELRLKLKNDMPVFDKPFSEVSKEYLDLQGQRQRAGEITKQRLATITSYVFTLNEYCGSDQISHVGDVRWNGYPLWRRSNGSGRAKGEKVSDWTIRAEMNVFRGIMAFGATKKYATERKFAMRALKLGKPRGEAFTPEEYKTLYTYSRDTWVTAKNEKKKPNKMTHWYRKVFHNFMLIMTNTGLRPPEAANLKRRDRADPRKDKGGQFFQPLRVRGKGKFRELVAPMSVATYLDRIYELMDERLKELKRTATPDDHVFLNWNGEPAKTLYSALFDDLLSDKHTNLLVSANGKRRSLYSFRHTYATFRILNGTDSFKLAQQMGTSAKEVQETYAHVTPSANADVILQGIPAWEMAEEGSGETASGVNADAAGAKAKPGKAKRREKALPTAGKASRSTRRR